MVGVRYERVDTDAEDVQGYSTDPAAPGMQFVDAEAFNASNRDKTDHNWDLTALARYTHDANLDPVRGNATGAE
jgi:iron complex outermembrane receptor protein